MTMNNQKIICLAVELKIFLASGTNHTVIGYHLSLSLKPSPFYPVFAEPESWPVFKSGKTVSFWMPCPNGSLRPIYSSKAYEKSGAFVAKSP